MVGFRLPGHGVGHSQLPSSERPHDVPVLGDTLAEDRGTQRIVAGYGHLACNGNGRLVMMEHEGGIEQVVGFRLGSGHGYGSGRGSGYG